MGGNFPSVRGFLSPVSPSFSKGFDFPIPVHSNPNRFTVLILYAKQVVLYADLQVYIIARCIRRKMFVHNSEGRVAQT